MVFKIQVLTHWNMKSDQWSWPSSFKNKRRKKIADSKVKSFSVTFVIAIYMHMCTNHESWCVKMCFFFFTVGRFCERCVKPQTTGPSLNPAHRHVLFGLHKEFLKRELNHLPTLKHLEIYIIITISSSSWNLEGLVSWPMSLHGT